MEFSVFPAHDGLGLAVKSLGGYVWLGSARGSAVLLRPGARSDLGGGESGEGLKPHLG